MKDKDEAPPSEPGRKDFVQLLADWREIFTHGVDEAEKFTREKPSVGLAIAFFAGTLLSSLWRRR
jgi:hypothetical protein